MPCLPADLISTGEVGPEVLTGSGGHAGFHGLTRLTLVHTGRIRARSVRDVGQWTRQINGLGTELRKLTPPFKKKGQVLILSQL